MADKKISELASASTPLAGTEVLAIVQSNETKKITHSALIGNIYSGTYTPTGYTGTNTTVVTPSECQYLRVGNTVTVSGNILVTATAAAATFSSFTIDLPIASSLTAASQGGGTAVALSTTTSRNTYASIYVETGNDRMGFNFASNYAGINSFYFSFTYRVI